MKNVIKFVVFLIYTVLIFFINSYELIVLVTLINILLMLVLIINIKSALLAILKIFWLILFTTVINIIFASLENGILIGIRLILVCNITYIFSKIFTYTQLAETIEKMCLPLKVLKVDTHQIGLMICIAVAFIPILKNEIQQIKLSLKSKGNNNIFIMFQPFLINLFKRVNQIEESIKLKGWEIDKC